MPSRLPWINEQPKDGTQHPRSDTADGPGRVHRLSVIRRAGPYQGQLTLTRVSHQALRNGIPPAGEVFVPCYAVLVRPGTIPEALAANTTEAAMLREDTLILVERPDGAILGHWYDNPSAADAHWRLLEEADGRTEDAAGA